jgi:hypothetical protein
MEINHDALKRRKVELQQHGVASRLQQRSV